MKSSSLVLIAETAYAAGTVTITGTRQKGVGYYIGQGNGQNIRFIANDFPGVVTIQASLDTDPKTADSYPADYPTGLIEADWFDVYTFPGDSAIDGSSAITTDYSIYLPGKYTWVRAVVTQFTSGVIGPITMSYQEEVMLKKLVIIPGGFHPFHAGHKALYDAAVAQFPKADVFIAATDDKSNRPFPFKLKKQLAGIAGIPAHRFVQVKSPFQPREITDLYDPETTQLIFVRSDKDSGVSPMPGGFKKDGSASYLQPLKRQKPENMKQHGFMTYLPTVQFGPGMTSATEIRAKWSGMSDEEKIDLINNLYPMSSGPVSNKAIEIFNTVLAEEKELIAMPMGSIKKTVEEDKKCDPGEYYCRMSKKCKPIPKGYHVMPDGELMKDSEHKVKETRIINKGDEVAILPAGGMGSHSEASLKSNLGDKLRTLADMLDDENYDNLEYVIYKSGAMESLVGALRQYQSFKNKRGARPIKKDVEIDISNESGFSKELPTIDQEMDSYFNSRKTKTEDYLPEDETLQEYVFQSRPLRVLDNIASRNDVQKFPIKFDDGTTVEVSPKMAKKFMDIYTTKDTDTQKIIDKKISRKEVFVKTFNDLMQGKRTTGVTVGDIR